jgi:choline kinase
MKAIILAAVQGNGWGNDLSQLPKRLLKIGNNTIIEKQLN